MKSFIRNNEGVSLVELMIVLIILAVGIIPIAQVQTRSNRDVFTSGQRTEALNIAQMRMEQARSLGFNVAVSDSGTAGNYDWWTFVQPAGIQLETVTVVVRWQEGANTQTMTLQNLMSGR